MDPYNNDSITAALHLLVVFMMIDVQQSKLFAVVHSRFMANLISFCINPAFREISAGQGIDMPVHDQQ